MATSLVSAAFTLVLLGQVPADSSAAKTDLAEELRVFKEKAAELSLYRGREAKEPQPLLREPVLRYNNPERDFGTLDGATFLWLEGAAPGGCFVLHPPRRQCRVSRMHVFQLRAAGMPGRRGLAMVAQDRRPAGTAVGRSSGAGGA